MASELLGQARQVAGISQGDVAHRSGTSRTALSAYENGHKSPSLSTASRILEASGFRLDLAPIINFADVETDRHRVITVPQRLWRLPLSQALADVELPLHLNWSARGRVYSLRDRNNRARVYEIVLREGTAEDLLTYIDGALLVDLWSELVLPNDVRQTWEASVADDLSYRPKSPMRHQAS
jgi:transcriptional regulator with XRE-family HTH domain